MLAAAIGIPIKPPAPVDGKRPPFRPSSCPDTPFQFSSRRLIPTLPAALIILPIALAGTGSGPGIREGGGSLPFRVGTGGM